jgi:hypothetical protein
VVVGLLLERERKPKASIAEAAAITVLYVEVSEIPACWQKRMILPPPIIKSNRDFYIYATISSIENIPANQNSENAGNARIRYRDTSHFMFVTSSCVCTSIRSIIGNTLAHARGTRSRRIEI